MSKVAFITGGNRGVGFETAKALGAQGISLVIGCRDLTKGQAAAKELQDKKEAEAKAEAERIAAEKKAANAPVKEKLSVAINGLSLALPDSEITHGIMDKFNGFKSWALRQIDLI